MTQHLRHSINQDWVTFIILGCLLFIAIIKYKHPKKFEDFILIISSDKFLSGSIHDNRLFHPFNATLTFVQWITFSLFIYIGYCFYTDKGIGQEFTTFLYILVGYIAFEQLKLWFERFIGYLIRFNKIIKPYTYRKLVFKNSLSLIILFFCIVLVYRSTSLKDYYGLFLGIAILLYIVSLFLMIRKFQNKVLARPSYFILYFCTLEIAPYYILYKVFI